MRKHPLLNESYYHVFNRGVEKRRIFENSPDYERFTNTIKYYSYHHSSPKLSEFLHLKPEAKAFVLERRKSLGIKGIDIVSFAFMPNHFHFILRQNSDDGISTFMQDISNSYTKYFNTKYERTGHLLQGVFKSVPIESEDQLLQVSRYIHLNPLTNNVVSNWDELLNYPWTSLPLIKSNNNNFINCDILLSLSNNSSENYLKFVQNQSDDQKSFENMQRLTLD